MNIQGRHRESYGLPRNGGGGQNQAELGGRPAHDVDARRVRDEAANAVAVAVHRDVNGRLVFGVAIDANAQLAGPIDEAQGFTRLERSAAEPRDQHARALVVEFDFEPVREIEHFGKSRGFGEAGLGGVPFPEGRGLKKDRPSFCDAQWTRLKDDLDARPAASDVDRV